jgi:hypothetical protein
MSERRDEYGLMTRRYNTVFRNPERRNSERREK